MRTVLPVLLLVATPAAASVYVVDDNGGPGVQFTDLPAAIAATGPLDVLLVRPGNYSSIQLAHGLSILADSGVFLSPGYSNWIQSIPPDQRVVLSGLAVRNLHVGACDGPVLLDRITGLDADFTIDVYNSADVRLRSCTNFALIVDGARVEVTSSTIRGVEGEAGCEGFGCSPPYDFHPDGYPGGPGIDCRSGGTLHASLCSITGGRGGAGGYWPWGCPNGNGGAGGVGVQVQAGGTVLLTGSGVESISGGEGGPGAAGGGCPSGFYGPNGTSATTYGGTILYSNVVFTSPPAGNATRVDPPDPALRVAGSGTPGNTLTYTVYGEPGDVARLRLGRRLLVEDVPGVFEDRLTIPLRSYLLGTLSIEGRATFSLTVPAGLPPGFVLVAQASTTSPATETRLTQSAPVAIR